MGWLGSVIRSVSNQGQPKDLVCFALKYKSF